jgi:hypothetical protein
MFGFNIDEAHGFFESTLIGVVACVVWFDAVGGA